MLSFICTPVLATTWYLHDGDAISDYTEVSGTVDTQPGDTIFLYNGTYGEFTVHKPPHLSIIGEGADLVTVSLNEGGVLLVWEVATPMQTRMALS